MKYEHDLFSLLESCKREKEKSAGRDNEKREGEREEAGGAEIKSLRLVLREKKERKSKVCGWS